MHSFQTVIKNLCLFHYKFDRFITPCLRLKKLSHCSFSFSTNSINLHHRQILISSSENVYHNLALEDWIYSNEDFNNKDLLLFWKNLACIVIGRHQNPWSECNIEEALYRGVSVARRRSGGGTVYHDTGNLNITFFNTRKGYDRKRNLSLLVDSLKSEYPHLDINVNQRDDIVVNSDQNQFGLKVSGSSAKLGAHNSYHHCTLLLNAELHNIRDLLKSSLYITDNKATSSVPSPVINLNNFEPSLDVHTALHCVVKGWDLHHSHQSSGASSDSSESFVPSSTISIVDPTCESSFPGVGKLAAELESWDWIYGKTPKFTIESNFNCGLIMNFKIQLDKGKIDKFEITSNDSATAKDFCQWIEAKLDMVLIGVEFRARILGFVLAKLAFQLKTDILEGALPFDITPAVIFDLFDHIVQLCQQ